MSQAIGDCPVCKKAFSNTDDVVVCPSCGAPYHRACYQKTGQCAYLPQHGGGFVHTPVFYNKPAQGAPPATNPPPVGTQQGGYIPCSVCNKNNLASHIFCEYCGSALHTQNVQGPAGFKDKMRELFFYEEDYIEPLPGAAQPQNQPGAKYQQAAQATAESIDGVSTAEWTAFIGKNANVYLHHMRAAQSQMRHFSFFFSAFFVSPFYFAYRKMWGWAALALFCAVLFALPQLLLFSINSGANLIPALSPAVLSNIDIVFTYLSLAMRLMFGVFALRLYKTHAKKDMKLIKDTESDPANQLLIMADMGGVSNAGVAVVLAVLVLLCFGFAAAIMSAGGGNMAGAMAQLYGLSI